MANTGSAPTYTGTPQPTATGQVFALGGSDLQELAYKGSWTVTLDGAATTVAVNWIDGTSALFFTQTQSTTSGASITAAAPTACLVGVTGGTLATTAHIGVNVVSLTNTGAVLILSGTGSTASTVKVAFVVFK